MADGRGQRRRRRPTPRGHGMGLSLVGATRVRFPFERQPVESPSQLDLDYADATDADCGNSPDGSGILFRRSWHRQSGPRRAIATRPGVSRRTVTTVLGPEPGRGFHRIRIERRLGGLVLLVPGKQEKAQAPREVAPQSLKSHQLHLSRIPLGDVSTFRYRSGDFRRAEPRQTNDSHTGHRRKRRRPRTASCIRFRSKPQRLEGGSTRTCRPEGALRHRTPIAVRRRATREHATHRTVARK
jgi:hypothetical protein